MFLQAAGKSQSINVFPCQSVSVGADTGYGIYVHITMVRFLAQQVTASVEVALH
jgi:hypothetical protein